MSSPSLVTAAAAPNASAATPPVVTQTPAPAPAVARDTIISSSPAVMNPARALSLKEKISKGLSYSIAAPIMISLMPLMGIIRLLVACTRSKIAPNSPEAIRLTNEKRAKHEKKMTVEFVQRRIKEKMDSYTPAVRRTYKEDLRRLEPLTIASFAKAAVSGVVGMGEWKEEPGIFNEAFRIVERAFTSITTVQNVYIPFPMIMEPYSTELLSLQRRFDGLPKACQRQYRQNMFKTPDEMASVAARALMIDARALGDRMLIEIPPQNYRADLEEGVQLYLRQNPY